MAISASPESATAQCYFSQVPFVLSIHIGCFRVIYHLVDLKLISNGLLLLGVILIIVIVV